MVNKSLANLLELLHYSLVDSYDLMTHLLTFLLTYVHNCSAIFVANQFLLIQWQPNINQLFWIELLAEITYLHVFLLWKT